MDSKPVIFLDDGGVMNDNRLRGAQWQRLVGEFFVPRLGGTLLSWAEANRLLMQDLFEPERWQRRVQAALDYAAFEHTYWCDWVAGMCQLVGVETPPEAACIVLAGEAEAFITGRVYAAFPGAIEAIRELHRQGYTLHTASSESSLHLHGYLQAMGVRECFGRLYGSDMLKTLKVTPAYYERLFADAGLAPSDALIVDDSLHALQWARDLGAMTVLVHAQQTSLDGIPCIADVAALPAYMQHLSTARGF